MHGSIRNDLENLLAGKARRNEVSRHLESCPECVDELALFASQNELFQSLRVTEDMEPAGGFYARVMQRIEERAKDSIWAVFVYSPFGRRLAVASFSLAVLLSSYVVAQEKLDGHLMQSTSAVEQVHYDVPVVGDQAQQRDAVLQNFAIHE
jgi:anti-sigma factor RsiW